MITVDSLDVLMDFNSCLETEFPNHSPFCDEEFVTVEQCADSTIAANNCHIVSSVLIEEAGVGDLISLEFNNDSIHDAILVGDMVFDYTTRQFNEEAAFPYTADIATWKEFIDTSAHEKYGIHVTGVNYDVVCNEFQ